MFFLLLKQAPYITLFKISIKYDKLFLYSLNKYYNLTGNN